MINKLPLPIIETILSLLPFKEAARTSILSKEWKYHWTHHPKLEFIEDLVRHDMLNDRSSITSKAKRKLFRAIKRVMLLRHGPIHEFSLSIYAKGPHVEIDCIIDNLSMNNTATLKKLTLITLGYWLPESIFSLHKLTDLYLHHCRLDVQPTFSGFGSLANLYMENVTITTKMLILFLSRCPFLKTVFLDPEVGSSPAIDDSATVVELFESLSVIETLYIHLPLLGYFGQGRVPKKLPAALVHLKYLCIRDMHMPLAYTYRIPCYAFLIRSSPNLEKLKLEVSFSLSFGFSVNMGDYSDMWLEHLNELEIELRAPRRYNLDFVRLILARSPVLKKVKIVFYAYVSKDEQSKILRFISQSPRVSPGVEIIVETGRMFGRSDHTPFKRTKDW